MNEKPLERLNYHNGQRLEASDFKTEQEYHIRTRRWLNKSLYSAGIARGLEVRAITEGPKANTPYVSVSPGLALDNEGREIILLENATVEVCSYAGTNESTVVGNYLVIEYAEETIAYEKGGCAVRATGTSANKSTTNWGGPSRIQSQVKFSWVPFVPHPCSNQIVLAQVELAERCSEVHQIDTGARRYIGAASAATVRQYALEGERVIAAVPTEPNDTTLTEPIYREVGTIIFHIRGRTPSSVTMYLQAAEFSALAYTELGSHSHRSDAVGKLTSAALKVDEHGHVNNLVIVGNAPSAPIVRGYYSNWDASYGAVNALASVLKGNSPTLADIFSAITSIITGGLGRYDEGPAPPQADKPPYMMRAITLIGKADGDDGSGHTISLPPADEQDLTAKLGMKLTGLSHEHPFSGSIGNMIPAEGERHKHEFSMSITATDAKIKARSGSDILNQIANLRIEIDGQEHTDNILRQIRDALPMANRSEWDALGDGRKTHPLVVGGTGAIRLDFLPHVSFGEGQHVIKLWTDLKDEKPNGGKIHYNLYIE